MSWVFRNGRLVEKHGPDDIRVPVARSHLPTPYVVSDTLPDLIGHHDGKRYDSKSSLRRSYKQAGVMELGNDAASYRAPDVTKKVTKADVAAALRKVKEGYRPAPLPATVLPDD